MGIFFEQSGYRYLYLYSNLCLCLLGTASTALGQVVPDSTLPNNTVVIPNGNTSTIVGGTPVGNNLFHSFSEFSIPTGATAFFNNPVEIQNILSRVTGANVSTIDGAIAANGTANLFLINPNGIVFGSNAQLLLNGSFIASTASSIRFVDGSEFSATNPQAPPLLTINVPIGVQFGSNPKSIINRSIATSPVPLPPPLDSQTPVGLQVPPGQTLALIGGDLLLESGNLTAFQGNILLGSVASPGVVSLNPTSTGFLLGYPGISNFGNIELSGTSSVTTSGLGGGGIQITGGRVTMRDRSNLVSDTLGTIDSRGINIQAVQFSVQDRAFIGAATLGTGAGGNIDIRATDSVELVGIGFENFQRRTIEPILSGTLPNLFNRESAISTGTVGAGKAGNITIETQQLRLQEGALILGPTFGKGDGGNITINAAQLVDVSASGLLTTSFNQGNAGSLTINTGTLSITDEASVSTITFGEGNGGNIIVQASDSVILSEFKEESAFGTNLSTSTAGSTGNGGNINIDTGSLLVVGGATIASSSGIAPPGGVIPSSGQGGNITINASDSVTVTGTSDGNPPSRSQVVTATVGDAHSDKATLGSADSGKLTINTRRLLIQDGGGVGASTVGSGKGGDVEINATESVEVAGKTKNGVSPSGLATASGDPLLQSFYPGQLNPTGAAGNIDVTTGRLIVRDGASVNVQSVGKGSAGTITVVADAIALDNGGSIDASTGSGAGGNINLQAQNIQLRRNSKIRTDAAQTDGGNITLEMGGILLMRDNSLISTTAGQAGAGGDGGNITIKAGFVIGVPQENSDIIANAFRGNGGKIEITANDILGLKFRNQLTPYSDITAFTASPQLGFSPGEFTPILRNPYIQRQIIKLPESLTDSSDRITTGCRVDQGNSFTVTGRGGLPEDPTATLRGRTLWRDLRLSRDSSTVGEQGNSGTGDQVRIAQSQASTQNQQATPLVEATGWIINTQGQVELVAQNPEVTVYRNGFPPDTCSLPNSN